MAPRLRTVVSKGSFVEMKSFELRPTLLNQNFYFNKCLRSVFYVKLMPKIMPITGINIVAIQANLLKDGEKVPLGSIINIHGNTISVLL